MLQKWPFIQLFFFSQDWPGKCLLRYSRTKKRLSIPKTRSSKSEKSDVFPKGLTHAFGPKVAIIANFFLGNIGQENVFYDILEQKNAFLGCKNKKFKKSKNWHFSMELLQKRLFFTLFFRQYSIGKCLLRYSKTKTHLSRL